MFCQNCGAQIAEGKNFCPNCGQPVGGVRQGTPVPPVSPVQAANQPQQANAPGKKKPKVWLIVLIAAGSALVLIAVVTAILVHAVRKAADDYMESAGYEEEISPDIDLDSLDEAVDSINDLDLDSDWTIDDQDDAAVTEDSEPEDAQSNFTAYSYTDVTVDGNDITIVPNGNLNGSTKLFNDKDLDGYLDYVDSVVLEEGRTINREFFYDILSTMLVGEEMNIDADTIKEDMMMALALANNFYNMDVRITEAYLDAANAADYHYKVKAYGDKDDIWLVNFGDRTVYFNDGGTEYHSSMFENEYLAAWLVSIDEYFGLD